MITEKWKRAIEIVDNAREICIDSVFVKVDLKSEIHHTCGDPTWPLESSSSLFLTILLHRWLADMRFNRR